MTPDLESPPFLKKDLNILGC